MSLSGPGLSFSQHSTPEWQVLDGAPAKGVRGLHDQVLAAVRERFGLTD